VEVTLCRDWFDPEVALVVAASEDPVLVRETYLPPGMDAAAAKRWILGHRWAYFVHVDDEPAGMVLFHPKEATAEVEVWLLERFRGAGNGRRALREALALAAHRWAGLTAWVYRSDGASLGVLRDLGFEFTGRERDLDGGQVVELARQG
jgi:RimJ/RimL family protein N-acetyltransferase